MRMLMGEIKDTGTLFRGKIDACKFERLVEAAAKA
jgi:hypothetical protein